jgi:hypothetical protein
MIQNKAVWGLFDPANPDPTRESAATAFQTLNALPVPFSTPKSVSLRKCFISLQIVD